MLPLLALALMGGGFLASQEGQRQGARATDRTMAQAMRARMQRQKESIALASAEAAKQKPAALQQAMEASQAPAHAEADRGQSIADAFSAHVGEGSGEAYRGAITAGAGGAATTAGDIAGDRAISQSFADALRARAARMREMQMQQEFIGEDDRRAQDALPGELARAGEAGANLRMAGGLASGIGAGGMMGNMYAPKKRVASGIAVV